MIDLPQLTARGVILSLLVSNHPARPTPAQVVRAAAAFGIKESAARVALSRMVSDGDLTRTRDGFRLSVPLLERRQRVLHEVEQGVRPWNGEWEIVVVTGTGRDPGDRVSLRTRLSRLRLAELREGVWLRPANLTRTLDLGGEPVEVLEMNIPSTAVKAKSVASTMWGPAPLVSALRPSAARSMPPVLSRAIEKGSMPTMRTMVFQSIER